MCIFSTDKEQSQHTKEIIGREAYISECKVEAKKHGLTYLGYSDVQGLHRYKFDTCGHIIKAAPATLIRHTRKDCCHCIEERIQDAARLRGLEVIGSAKHTSRYSRRRYRRIECGHEFDADTHNIAKSSLDYRCSQCFEDKINENASAIGATYLGKSNRKGGYRDFVLECGHKKTIRPDQLTGGNFICRECNRHYLYAESSVYVLLMYDQRGFEWVKVGHSYDVVNRIDSYNRADGVQVTIIEEFCYDDGFEALKVEKGIHKLLEEYRMPKELMKQYMESGFTECYYPSVLDLFS